MLRRSGNNPFPLLATLISAILVLSCDSTDPTPQGSNKDAAESTPLLGGTPTDLIGAWSSNFSNGYQNIFQVDSFLTNDSFVIRRTDSLNKSYSANWRESGSWSIHGNLLILKYSDIRYNSLGADLWSGFGVMTMTRANDTFEFEITNKSLILRSQNRFGSILVRSSSGSAPATGIGEPQFFLIGQSSTYWELRFGSATPGAIVYFTTDGSSPTTSSRSYASAVANGLIYLDSTATIKAIAFKDGAYSTISSKTVYVDTIATPTFSLASGKYDSAVMISISCQSPGATIYFRQNERIPMTGKSILPKAIQQGLVTKYTGPISLSKTTTIYAIAQGSKTSKTATATFGITVPPPVFSPAGGEYSTVQLVSLSASNDGTIHFTTDGSLPTASSPTYAQPIQVGTSQVIKAVLINSPDTSKISSAEFKMPFAQLHDSSLIGKWIAANTTDTVFSLNLLPNGQVQIPDDSQEPTILNRKVPILTGTWWNLNRKLFLSRNGATDSTEYRIVGDSLYLTFPNQPNIGLIRAR